MITPPLLAALEEVPLLPVLRCGAADDVMPLAARLVDGGLRALELTTTTPGWEEAVGTCIAAYPDVVIGVGTVTTREHAERALATGARFLVSPYPAPEVRSVAADAEALFVEGGFTPAEVADATRRGPAKLFPAHVGGPQYLRSLLAVLPGAVLVPTGGIRLEDVATWLAAGATAVGVGSDLTAPGDVGERVRAAVERRPAP